MRPSQHVIPTRSLFFTEMPCEIKCAGIHNNQSMRLMLIALPRSAYRFLQTATGALNTLTEATAFSAIFLFCTIDSLAMYLLSDSEEDKLPPSTALLLLLPIGHILPNMHNTLRYRLINQKCEEWLISNLGADTFTQIKSLNYNKEGIESLTQILSDRDIDCDFIENRFIDETELSIWNFQR